VTYKFFALTVGTGKSTAQATGTLTVQNPLNGSQTRVAAPAAMLIGKRLVVPQIVRVTGIRISSARTGQDTLSDGYKDDKLPISRHDVSVEQPTFHADGGGSLLTRHHRWCLTTNQRQTG